SAGMLVRIVACGEELGRVMARDPKVSRDEAGAAGDRRVGMSERPDILAGHQLVADRLTEWVRDGRIRDEPVTAGERVDEALSLGPAREPRAPRHPGVALRV